MIFCVLGNSPNAGVPDMTVISDIDEVGINRNLQVRYARDQIYVSFMKRICCIWAVNRWCYKRWLTFRYKNKNIACEKTKIARITCALYIATVKFKKPNLRISTWKLKYWFAIRWVTEPKFCTYDIRLMWTVGIAEDRYGFGRNDKK